MAGTWGIDPASLAKYGISEISYHSTFDGPAIKIAYRANSGVESGVRFVDPRTGQRQWRKGSKPGLIFGSWSELRSGDHVYLVADELSAVTCWSQGLKALARKEWTADAVSALNLPEGAEAVVVLDDLGSEAICDFLRPEMVNLRLIKDPGLAVPWHEGGATAKAFVRRLERLATAAKTVGEHTAEAEQLRRAQLEQAASGLCEEPDILQLAYERAQHLGLRGAEDNFKIMYLVCTSRLLNRPLSAAIGGPTSAGKSYLVETVLKLMPSRAYLRFSGLSNKALIYMREPLDHRVLYVAEAQGADNVDYMLRTLVSEGSYTHHVASPTEEGGWDTKSVLVEGPVSLVTTSTRTKAHPENETRLVRLTVADGKLDTSDIIRGQLAAASGAGEPPTVDVDDFARLQEWLAMSVDAVVIPFANVLAKLLPPVAVKNRRDVVKVLTMIQTHALLHQRNRRRDSQGRIEATVEDYEAVRGLLGPLLDESMQLNVTSETRATVDAVRVLNERFAHTSASVAEVARVLDLDVSATLRRVKVALSDRWLRDASPGVGDHMLVIGDALPKPEAWLPGTPRLIRAISRRKRS